MTRAVNRLFGIGALLMCCLLVGCATEAQNVAREALWSSDKLGLTADQKTKIEAVQKDVESQRQAVLDNKKLGRDERAARLIEINENERARLERPPDRRRQPAGDELAFWKKEDLGGKVQMIYRDPPYGIKYGSNFQAFVNERYVRQVPAD